jgi:hypothetical protein
MLFLHFYRTYKSESEPWQPEPHRDTARLLKNDVAPAPQHCSQVTSIFKNGAEEYTLRQNLPRHADTLFLYFNDDALVTAIVRYSDCVCTT